MSTSAGDATVRDTPIAMIGDRRLWVLDQPTRTLFAATWRALDAEYAGEGPVGLFALFDEADPRAEWTDPRTIYFGYAQDGRQARVAYFDAARTTPMANWPAVDPPYRVEPFASQTAVTPDDVVGLWLREAALPEPEARRRVDEVLLVATDLGGELIGVATRYLQRNEQLQMDCWYVRVFVAASHRRSTVATALSVGARDHLHDAFVSGRDTRAAAFVFAVENQYLKAMLPEPIWNEVSVLLISETDRGDHVRVYFFEGAQAPIP